MFDLNLCIMKIIITRIISNRQCVFGWLNVFSNTGIILYRCYTLELPNLKNKARVSCIPAGIYKGMAHKSPKNGLCIQLSDVPGRSYIQIHAGNSVADTLGCILVGEHYRMFNPEHAYELINSRIALSAILKNVAHNPIIIEIYDRSQEVNQSV